MLSFGFTHLRAVPLFFCVLFFASTAQAQKAPETRPFEIKLDETEAYFFENNMRISAITGKPIAIYKANYEVRSASPENMAEQYLKGNAPLLGLKHGDLSDLEHHATRTSQVGHTVRYKQHYRGIPVYNAELTVNISPNNVVNNVSSSYRPRIKLGDITPSIDEATARQLAHNYIGLEGSIKFERNRLIVYSIKGNTRLAYEIRVIASAPMGEWVVYVDAETQEIFKAEDIAYYYKHSGHDHGHDHDHGKKAKKVNSPVNGFGNIFDPDPLSSATTTYNTGGYTDNGDLDSPDLNSQLVSVTLLDIDLTAGVYTLKGPYAEEVDWDAPINNIVSQNTDDFSYNREDDQFEAVNTYYHIDYSMRYINQTLNCPLEAYQYPGGGIQFDPHGANSADNSYYTSGTGQLSFGEGCVDDAEDSDVIHHELGHGIHDWITSGGLSQVDGLSEGCGDYWAQSYNRFKGFWTAADPQYNWIFNWDGHNDCWDGRISDYAASYPGGLTGSIHTDGQIWSTCMMEVWNLIGQQETDKIFLMGLGMTNGTSSQNDAANAVYQAAIDLAYPIADIQTIHTTLTSCGYTLPDPPGPPTANIAAESTVICLDEGGVANFMDASSGVATSWNWTFPGGTPGTSTLQNPTVTYGATGLYDVTLTVTNTDGTDTQTFTNFIEVVSGTDCPSCFSYSATDVPITISDGAGASYTSTINVASGPTTLTDVNMVNVNGTHTYIGDLTFVLTSPNGTSVILLDESCTTEEDFDLGFDDSATGTPPCPPVGGGTYPGVEMLAAFNGENANGDWVLTVTDNANIDGGSLEGWTLELCGLGGSAQCNLSLTGSGSNDLCGTGNANATVTPTAGTGPYTYLWDAAANSQITQTAFSLFAGTYTVTVTDNTGCADAIMVTVTGAAPFQVDIQEPGPISCPGAADGELFADVSGGTGPFIFDWDNTIDVQGPFALAAGTYTLTLSDVNNCEIIESYTLNEPSQITASFTTTPDVCDNKDGTATVTPAGGSGANYTFEWDGNAASQVTAEATGLAAGDYVVSVTDGSGCISTATVTVNGTSGPVITGFASAATCTMSNGSATASANGGTTPYTYLWDAAAGSQVTETAINLAAGTYSVSVSDNAGCTSVASVTVGDNCTGCALTATFQSANELCGDDCNGSATVIPSNGTGPFGYLWDNGTTSDTRTGLCAGTYTVTVADATGCTATSAVTITGPAAITATTASTSESCAGNDGSATASGTGGTGNLTYQWDAAAGNQTAATAIDLAAGSYTVVIIDDNNCSITETVNVADGCSCAIAVAVSSTNATCGAASGTATANPAGGTTPYSYLWSDTQMTQTAIDLAPGTYMVTVVDASGCPSTSQVTVGDSGVLNAQLDSEDLACNGDFSGSVSVTNPGSYNYIWNTTATTATIDGLAAGTYTVTVSQGSCSDVQSVTLTEPSAITTNLIKNDNFCAENSASINAAVFGGVQPYTYIWSNNGNGSGIGGLSSGTYTLTLVDGVGCVLISSISVVSEANGPVLSSTHSNVSCVGDNDGAIDLTVNGGTPPFNYNWGNGINIEDLNGLSPGTYTVQVRDANACLAVTSVNITEPTGMTLTYNTTPADQGESNGSAGVNVAGGVPPFAYQWDNGQNTQVAINLPAGEYSVFVTDANGCTIQGTTTVGVYSGIVNLENLLGFELNPNPSDGKFVVDLTFENREEATLHIFNVLGQEYFRKELSGTNFNIPVDLRDETAGIYFAIVKTNKGSAVKRFVITE